MCMCGEYGNLLYVGWGIVSLCICEGGIVSWCMWGYSKLVCVCEGDIVIGREREVSIWGIINWCGCTYVCGVSIYIYIGSRYIAPIGTGVYVYEVWYDGSAWGIVC